MDDPAQKFQEKQWDAEIALLAAIQAGYIQAAQNSLTQMVARGTFITTVITALGGSYTALVGLVYGVGEHANPMPPRGVVPVIFLGIALLLSTVFMSFLRPGTMITDAGLLETGIGGTIAEDRLQTFFAWTFSGVLARAWALRGAVISLGIGTALLPLPFLEVRTGTPTAIAICTGAIILAVWGIVEHRNRFTSYIRSR